MVTKQKISDTLDERGFEKSTSFDWKCLSTDEKPTEDVNTNDLLLELDTGKGYYFDGANWNEIGG